MVYLVAIMVYLVAIVVSIHHGMYRPKYAVCVVVYSRWSGVMKESNDDADTTLNIFSLASGHLYERFLRYTGHKLLLLCHVLCCAVLSAVCCYFEMIS